MESPCQRLAGISNFLNIKVGKCANYWWNETLSFIKAELIFSWIDNNIQMLQHFLVIAGKINIYNDCLDSYIWDVEVYILKKSYYMNENCLKLAESFYMGCCKK